MESEGVPKQERDEIVQQLVIEEVGMTDIAQTFFNQPSSENNMQSPLGGMMTEMLSFIPTKEEFEELPENMIAESEYEYFGLSIDEMNELPTINSATGDIFAYYVYTEDLLDPTELFEETRSFYRKYRWPNRIFTAIQAVILALILLIAILVLFSLIDSTVPPQLPEIIGALGVLWAILEVSLWHVLNLEVEMSSRTFVGKFLKPDPRDFI